MPVSETPDPAGNDTEGVVPDHGRGGAEPHAHAVGYPDAQPVPDGEAESDADPEARLAAARALHRPGHAHLQRAPVEHHL